MYIYRIKFAIVVKTFYILLIVYVLFMGLCEQSIYASSTRKNEKYLYFKPPVDKLVIW